MELDHNSHSVFLLYYHLVMVIELRELLCSGAIRRHQLGAKDLLTPTSSYESDNEDTYLDQIRIGNVHWQPSFLSSGGLPLRRGQAALVCSDFP